MKIDLQLHTSFSDGLNTPEELAKLAHEGGLTIISVTDHDRVDSVAPVKAACAQYGITVIPGVEISTTYEGKALHILGYNMDIENEDFLALIKKINGFRKEKFLEKFPFLIRRLPRRENQKRILNAIKIGIRATIATQVSHSF